LSVTRIPATAGHSRFAAGPERTIDRMPFGKAARWLPKISMRAKLIGKNVARRAAASRQA